jgi:hypothetical protein
MLNLQQPVRRRSREEGEKPFWISFSDLMSAMMVLFLVAMSVALLAVTKKQSEEEREEKDRSEAITRLMGEIEKSAIADGVRVTDRTIDFGPRGQFEREGQNTLSPAQQQLVMRFTPQLLNTLRSQDGARWFKRAVVEGYASSTGTYLFNLNLSLERSERVLCELLREVQPGTGLSLEDRKLVATKFFVGGASFNSLRSTADASRRIEFKLEFKTRQDLRDEKTNPTPPIDDAALVKALDPRERCPIFDR